jgi:ABC-type branched-subunit amino acid transport system substrate-binding protein
MILVPYIQKNTGFKDITKRNKVKGRLLLNIKKGYQTWSDQPKVIKNFIKNYSE